MNRFEGTVEFAGPEGVLLPALLLKEQRRSADPFHLEVNRDLNAVGDPDEGNAAVHAEFFAIERHCSLDFSRALALTVICEGQRLRF